MTILLMHSYLDPLRYTVVLKTRKLTIQFGHALDVVRCVRLQSLQTISFIKNVKDVLFYKFHLEKKTPNF